MRSWLGLMFVVAAAICIGGWADSQADGPPSKPALKGKMKHPPVTAIRDRMLVNFHGRVTDIFADIPGFGGGRMGPLYKYVPFRIPDLSTNEVEVADEVRPTKQLETAYAKSLAVVSDALRTQGRISGPRAKDIGPVAGFGRSDVYESIAGGLQLRLLDLVGLIDQDGPRVYCGGKAFEREATTWEEMERARKNKKTDALFPGTLNQLPPTRDISANSQKRRSDPRDDDSPETRPLDVFETVGVAELRAGKDLFIRTRGNVIRMLGALRATGECLRCHSDNKKGDLLGAFSYTLVDVSQKGTGESETKAAK
jgi:hypothetical protein